MKSVCRRQDGCRHASRQSSTSVKTAFGTCSPHAPMLVRPLKTSTWVAIDVTAVCRFELASWAGAGFVSTMMTLCALRLNGASQSIAPQQGTDKMHDLQTT